VAQAVQEFGNRSQNLIYAQATLEN